MAYSPISATQFKNAKPQFFPVQDETVRTYLDLATLWVDETWPERLFEPAVISATCHLMTLDGLGIDPQSQQFKAGLANFQSFKSGEMTLARYQRAAGEIGFLDWLEQTACGVFFLQLLRLAKAGPRVAMGGLGACHSAYAKDWPRSFGYRGGPLE